MEQFPLFHKQIKLERERRGWSQEDLAKRVGCDVKTVRRWEKGERLPRSYHRQPLFSLFGKDARAFGLMRGTPCPLSGEAGRTLNGARQTGENVSFSLPCEDWHEAPVVVNLYGREQERDEL